MEKKGIKNSLSLKLFVVGFLTAILMIPTGMIAVLVNEREHRQIDAYAEVSEKWGGEQTIIGPILTVPYKKISESLVNGEKKMTETINYAHFLPEFLNIDGEISPETRQRGIYELVVYNTSFDLSGEFSSPDFSKWEIGADEVMYEKAFVSLGISDMRGVKESIILNWDEENIPFGPGIETKDVLSSGVSTNVRIDKNNQGKKYSFDTRVVLNGSRDLMFSPIGRETELKMSSSWDAPSFQGAFLPNDYEITDNGFSAEWKVLELNRNFPQSFLGSLGSSGNMPVATEYYEKARLFNNGDLRASNFGVRLLIPADEYQKTVRALKYAIMTLALTFLVLFFFEAINKRRVHPLQYILIGLALSLFYVLLLSIAEYLGFGIAYLISGLAIVSMIFLYSKSVLGAWRSALIESLVLIFIYGFIYVILQMEDYSLLVGAIGLFVILAIVMYVSRQIDWYNVGLEPENK